MKICDLHASLIKPYLFSVIQEILQGDSPQKIFFLFPFTTVNIKQKNQDTYTLNMIRFRNYFPYKLAG